MGYGSFCACRNFYLTVIVSSLLASVNIRHIARQIDAMKLAALRITDYKHKLKR
ncbi:hypothetical protein ACP4OV_002434 [Aristida adscensionis]